MPMIRRIQALNYGCLRHVDLALGEFHVLVGPNASGKSTLFDVVAFLGDMVRDGVEAAVGNRTDNFQDLVWGRPSRIPAFELAVEFEIPQDLRERLPRDKDFEVFRYEVRIGERKSNVTINTERALLMPRHDTEPRQPSLFPLPMSPVETILIGGCRRGARSILSKSVDRGHGRIDTRRRRRARLDVAVAGAGRCRRDPRPRPAPLGDREPLASCPRRLLRRGPAPQPRQEPAAQSRPSAQRRHLHHSPARPVRPRAPGPSPLRRPPAGRHPRSHPRRLLTGSARQRPRDDAFGMSAPPTRPSRGRNPHPNGIPPRLIRLRR